MHYKQCGDAVFVPRIDSFDIGETLESGQCFRFTKNKDNHYSLMARGRTLHVLQTDSAFTFYPCTPGEFETLWAHYFDLNRDYAAIKRLLSEGDPVMAEAISYAGGIRILNQDIWECLISFIISQNNNIRRVKQIVHALCTAFGDVSPHGFAFPLPSQLAQADVGALMLCKMGFRAKYILDAARKINEAKIKLDGFQSESTDRLREELQSIYGVGRKVADCVLLYSCGRKEVFPIDVWVNRIMCTCYFGGRQIPNPEIQAFAREKFGEYAGFAQQYLFHYARAGKTKMTSGVEALC